MSKFIVPKPDLQIEFFKRLAAIRDTYLLDALLAVVSKLEIPDIDKELGSLVSGSALRKVAGWGLRGEIIFPVPCVLRSQPRLLGYYRLLLGFSQKQFYGDRYGFATFKTIEDRGQLSANQEDRLRYLCEALCGSAELLINGTGQLSRDLVHDLTLLTLGPQLRGSILNVFGNRATRRVFELIESLVGSAIESSSTKWLKLINAAGRTVRVEFSSDPDICLREELPSGKYRNLVAIEIKGGMDYSNVHNRIGEAEKSHQKAREEGYVECWTMVGVADLGLELAKKESPSTDRFYHLDRIADGRSEEFEDFRENLLSRLGIVG